MKVLIGFLTFILILDCLFMMLLVLIQLPKKEAGLGTAFGSSTTDALFGAGTGNVLTKLTKYTAALFLGISMLLSVLITAEAKQPKGPGVDDVLRRRGTPAAVVTPPPVMTSNLVGPTPAMASNMMITMPSTNSGPSNAPPGMAQ
jgi:preprotein translocase subunit SecG